MSTATFPTMSPADYLVWERTQREKHQLIDGQVFAMAGGSPRHNHLCGRLLGQLYAALRGGACRAFTSDQKVHVPRNGNFVYPDVSIVCGPVQLHAGTSDVIDNPAVAIEVLSASTEKHDRGDKFADYRSVISLTDYLLVSQTAARVEHYTREADGSWRFREAGPGGRIELSTGTTLVVDELYEGAFELPGD